MLIVLQETEEIINLDNIKKISVEPMVATNKALEEVFDELTGVFVEYISGGRELLGEYETYDDASEAFKGIIRAYEENENLYCMPEM